MITPTGADSLQVEEIDEEKVRVLKSLGYLSGDYFRQGKIDLSHERADPKLNIEEINIFSSGEKLREEGKYEEAVAAFRNVLSKNPKNYQAKLHIMECYQAMRDYTRAEAEAVEAVKIAELDQLAMKAMASRLWNLYGFILEKKKDLEGAEQAYRKDYELNAHNERSFAFLVNFYINHKKYNKAMEIISDELTFDPDNILANTSLFYLHVEEKHIDQAAEIAKKLVHWNLSGDSHTLLLAGNVLKARGMFPEAVMAFEQVAKMKPQDTEILGNLGSLNLIMGNHIKAERDFEKILQIDPNEYKAHFYLGIIALKRNDEQGARKRFDRVLALRPTHYPVFDALGSWLKEKGRIEEAKDEFRKALSLNPDDQIAIQGLEGIRQ
jgi:tetratricopeptide (TPR) repeat protein